MAEVKPLRLRREKVQGVRARALVEPYARVLVDHQIFHLEHTFDYLVPEEFTDSAIPGALVEVEIGHTLTKGILLSRLDQSSTHGELKQILKVLTIEPYVLREQLETIEEAASRYGASPWDFIRNCVPPFSKAGERKYLETSDTKDDFTAENYDSLLPISLQNKLRSSEPLICAIETPVATPYWRLIVAVALERALVGDILVLAPNEREVELLNQEFIARGTIPIVIETTAGKSNRYFNYLRTRENGRKIILGTRSSALLPLSANATVVVQDDVDESHYERSAPTWNTRDLVQFREARQSVIYMSSTISLEIASRITAGTIPLFRFPETERIKLRSSTHDQHQDYFSVISEGLKRGSVLISVGATGYVTSFSCQKCRNIALCPCGGKLYFPARAVNPSCATCATLFIGWKCSWCHESKPRILKSGVERRAEEFGRAFPNHSVISSSSQNSISLLPEGRHLVLSTPGVEPRGTYTAQIFLDLEGRLLRTTLRATEELRLHILRTLSMLHPAGEVYLALRPAEGFLQSLLRRNTLDTIQREITERDGVSLPPNFFCALVSGDEVTAVIPIVTALSEIEIIGPFVRNGKKTILIKIPAAQSTELVQLLSQINRVQSMRKEPLLNYRLNPYSLN